MKLKVIFCALLLMSVFLYSTAALAQCPMCRATAETSLKEGSTYALGLNTGILYLLAFPYLICSVLFFLWYRNHRKNRLAA